MGTPPATNLKLNLTCSDRVIFGSITSTNLNYGADVEEELVVCSDDGHVIKLRQTGSCLTFERGLVTPISSSASLFGPGLYHDTFGAMRD